MADKKKRSSMMSVKEESAFKTFLFPTLIGMAVSLILIILVNNVFGIVTVDGSSMNPTYYDGDILHGERVTDKINIERGDIITFRNGAETLIKRVVGLPGETISFKDGYLYINGERMISDFPAMKDGGILLKGPITLADDEYFCLGDNRNNSRDSRMIGPIKRSQIDTVIVKTYFSFHK